MQNQNIEKKTFLTSLKFDFMAHPEGRIVDSRKK
jgi:hypothetical protein